MRYRPPLAYREPHLATILPSQLRPLPKLNGVSRQRVTLRDGDFVDVDINSNNDSGILALLIHGLEGSSSSSYMIGMTNAMMSIGLNVACLNLRGCSGIPNNLPTSYHSGRTDDLVDVLNAMNDATDIYLIGFSLGGNLTLKYLGEEHVDPRVKAAVAVSVPTDLKSSAERLERWDNVIYRQRFLKQLKRKVREKNTRFGTLKGDVNRALNAKTIAEFDDSYTAPMHGFESADDYYNRCSSNGFIEHIKTPTLLINAQDDPFLTPTCFPIDLCANNANVTFLNPRFGGHVGFSTSWNMKGPFWHEVQAIDFIRTFNP